MNNYRLSSLLTEVNLISYSCIWSFQIWQGFAGLKMVFTAMNSCEGGSVNFYVSGMNFTCFLFNNLLNAGYLQTDVCFIA